MNVTVSTDDLRTVLGCTRVPELHQVQAADRLAAAVMRAEANANPWIPADPDGLPPATYPKWRSQEITRRGVAPS